MAEVVNQMAKTIGATLDQDGMTGVVNEIVSDQSAETQALLQGFQAGDYDAIKAINEMADKKIFPGESGSCEQHRYYYYYYYY